MSLRRLLAAETLVLLLMLATLVTSPFLMSQEVSASGHSWSLSDPFAALLIVTLLLLLLVDRRLPRLVDRPLVISLVFGGIIVASGLGNDFNGPLLQQLRTWMVSTAFYFAGRYVFTHRGNRLWYLGSVLLLGAAIALLATVQLHQAFGSAGQIKKTPFYGALYSNQMGTCEVLLVLTAVSMFRTTRRWWYLSVIGVGALAILMSLSRVAILTLIIGVGILTIWSRGSRLRYLLILGPFLLGVLLLPGYLQAYFPHAYDLYAGKQSVFDEFVGTRTTTLNLVPIASALRRPLEEVLLGNADGTNPFSMHSIWASTITMYGVIGALVLLLYHLALLRPALRGLSTGRGATAQAGSAYLALILVMMLSDYSTNLRFNMPFVAYVFCTLCGFFSGQLHLAVAATGGRPRSAKDRPGTVAAPPSRWAPSVDPLVHP